MALIGTLFFIFTATCVGAQNVFATMQHIAESFGKHGQQSLLECVVQPTEEAAGLEIKIVSWKKEGVKKPLLVFPKSENTTLPTGYMFAEPSWNKKNMNVSLLITNTTMAHAGVYTCWVKINNADVSTTTNLKVTAKYSKPIIRSVPEKIPQNTDVALICDSDGGYPKGAIHWIVEHDTEWTKSSEMKAEPGPSGLFHLSSKLTLLRGSIFSKYTCVVVNASGGIEEETVFVIEDEPRPDVRAGQGGEKSDSTSKIVAPVVVIGSLIIGLMILLLYRRRRQNGHLTSNSSEEEEEEGLRNKDDGSSHV
ncbi:butyrophilin subfamily 2 member A2 [Hippoglossus stenolepis]|uniref:butyrophilin subfamily 2 member A2 n=1 Tax=Hippoglossus stenolepis TaxID=195615 RepID=UPI00159C0161|nr:butyrophilin subfamily 2 member A2 [Hippoglossus stenolepis]